MVETIENQLSLTCNTINDLPETAREVLEFTGTSSVIVFNGELGAGKTTIIKQICDVLGIKDNVSSPSFAIINEYLDTESKSIFHFDFSRIKDLEEAMDIGVEEYFYSGNLCLIEWPSKIGDLLPKKHFFVDIEVTGEESRIFHVKRYD